MKTLLLWVAMAIAFAPLAAHAQSHHKLNPNALYQGYYSGAPVPDDLATQTQMNAVSATATSAASAAAAAQTTANTAVTNAAAAQTTASAAVPYGLGIPSSYLGEVATRAAAPSTFIATAFTEFMSRSQHEARQKITQLQIVVPNFYIYAPAGEEGTGATATYTASIEYPAGTFHQIRFGGNVSGTVASGTTRLSDVVYVNIPNGAIFWVRMFYQNSAGVITRLWVNGQLQANGSGDATAFGTALTDQTMGGTVTSYNAIDLMYPLAIVAPTTLAAGCLYGDSRMLGTQDSDYSSQLDRGPVARYIGQRYAYINMGISSYTLGYFLSGSGNANQVAMAQYCSFGIDELGINDLAAGNTAATVEAERATFAALFPNLQMYGTTLEPETTSTDSWATLANQTVSSFNTVRLAVNAAIIAGIAGELNYIDISGMIDPTNSGKWPVTGVANGCTLDGVHEIAASAALSNGATACGGYQNPFRNIDFSRH